MTYSHDFKKQGACIASDKGLKHWCMSFLIFLSKFVNDEQADVVMFIKFPMFPRILTPELD